MDPKIASMLPGASNITSGLVPNERSAQLPSATASLLDKVGKRIGVRITIGAPTGEMGANGWYSNGNLVIASDAQNPLLVVLKHEVTHRLQEVAPEEYTRFRNYAVRQMALRGHGGDADRAVQDYRRRYAQKGYNLTVDGALDEMAADYTEHLMENPGEFERVVLDNRTVARKIYDAVRQVVASIRAAFTGSARDRTALELTGRSYAQLQEGLRLWESALRAAENVTRTAVDLREQGARAQMAQNIASMEPAAAAVMQESPQYSLWRSTRGDTVAVVDDDILADVPRAEWVEKVKNNIRNRFPDGIQIANSQIQVNQKTAREYLYSESTKTLRSKRPLVFADKLRATGNLDDILRATQTWKNEKPRHLRKDSFTSFARGDVLLRVGQNDYTADVIVGNTSGGNDVLYDIISMKPTQLTLKNEIRPNFKPSSRNGERQKTETYPIDSTIPQADSAVKGNLQVPSEPRGQASLKNQDSSGDMHDVLSRLAQDRAVSEEEIDSVPEIIEARKKVRPGSSADINTPEREALREQMAEEILSRGSAQRVTVDGKAKIVYTGPVRKDRRVDIVIGLPAAGKSSVIVDPLSEQHQSMVLDSDEVKFILPEFNNGIGSGYIHEESKEILGIIRDSAIERGDNIVTPIVGSSTNKVLGEIERYRNAGYSVYLHLNELPANKAIGRALQRFLDTGRFIDPDVLLKYGDKPTEVYERIREMEGVIDGYSRYSNDVKYGEPPILIEQSGPERVRNVPGAVSVSNDGGNAGGLRGRPAGAQAQNRGGSSQAQKASPGSVPLSTNTSGAAPLVDARQNEATGQMPGGLIAPLGVAAIPDLLAGMKTVNEQIGDLLNGLTPVSEQIDALLNGLTPVETTNENGYPMAHDALYTDSRVYDYDFMVSQPDMVVTRLPDMRAILDENGRVDRDEVRKSGLKNAGDAGEVREGEIFVRNNYTGRELKVTNKTIMHSAHGDLNMLLTNGRLGAVAGDLIKRSIPVNGLRNKKDGVAGAYAMAAYAIDGNGKEFVAIITVEQRTNLVSNIGLVDMAHSISGRIKRSPWFPQRNGGTATETGTPASKASSTISIADFLDIVNSTHQGILSNDVLRHYRAERDMESYWGRGVQFSLKDDGDVAAVPAAVDAAAGIPDLLAGMTPVNEQIGALLNGLTPVNMRGILSRLAQDRSVTEAELDRVAEIIEARKKVRPGSSADINTPEREALRDQKAAEILSRGSAQRVTVDGKTKIAYTGPVRKDHRVDIVIGLPAAGKSSVIVDPLSEQHQSMVLDSDEVKFILPEFNNGIGSGYIHEESKKILRNIRDAAIGRGDNIVTPIVGSNTNKVLDEIERYRNAGYSVYLHLNELPPNKALGRALQRFLDTGRFIDPDVLLKYGDKPTKVYECIREMEGVIDGYSRYSNDVKYGEPPILIEQSD
jgi:hypothetical protein